MDYVQVKRNEICSVKSQVKNLNEIAKVEIIVNEKSSKIISVFCSICDRKGICVHTNYFMFWVHRMSTEPDKHKNNLIFWGQESSKHNPIIIMKDLFMPDEDRIQADEEAANITEADGEVFLKAILDEMDGAGLTDSVFYKHCRQVQDDFEPLYIHHTMLDNANNYVKDAKSFNMHMEEVFRSGLFDRITDATVDNYKKHIWYEVQFGRIRCSMMHKIALRKNTEDDEEILNSIFCTDRQWHAEDRCQLKEHKRFILKQTEKLEDKSYRECGLLLNENYPYLCASPDGIADDHIVEIKAPRNDDEFEKYLEGKETISAKYMAQLQIQMYLANVTKALYCVLSPTFDSNGALHYVWVQADMDFVESLLSTAEDYWRDVVFPKICSIYVNPN